MIDFYSEFVTTFFKILYAPFNNPEMIWILIPLIITVILMELYFTRYPREELGYHAALENTVFLLFVAVDMVRYLVSHNLASSNIKVIFISVIFLFSFIVAMLDFFHKLPRELAFKVSSKAVIGFMAYVGIILVYTDILTSLDMISIASTLISFLILFIILKFFLFSIDLSLPKAHDDVEEMLANVESELRTAAKEARKQ